MKKLATTLLLVLGFTFGTAQKTTKTTSAKTEVKQKTKETKQHHTPPAKPTKLKKDGTPDRRYKENQKLKKRRHT